MPFKAIHLHPNSHAGYCPGAKPLALKVLFHPGSGELLGAQAVGEEGVDKRIDVIATAIQGGSRSTILQSLSYATLLRSDRQRIPSNWQGW